MVKEVVVWGDKSEEIIGEVVVAVVARHHPGVEVEEQADWHRFIPLIAKKSQLFLTYMYVSVMALVCAGNSWLETAGWPPRRSWMPLFLLFTDLR